MLRLTVGGIRANVLMRVSMRKAQRSERAFGEALRQIRRERNISQEALAREAGVDRTYVSMIERGLRSPMLRTLLRLAEVLEVSASDIVRGNGKRLRMRR